MPPRTWDEDDVTGTVYIEGGTLLLQTDIRGLYEGPTTNVLGNKVVVVVVACATEGGGVIITVDGIILVVVGATKFINNLSTRDLTPEFP